MSADVSVLGMKTLVVVLASVAFSVGGAGYYVVTSESEGAQKIYRGLLGISECEANTCSEVGDKPTCSSEEKSACGASCDEEKSEDQNPT